MNDALIPVRYATALYGTGQSGHVLPQLYDDLRAIDGICRTEPRFMEVLTSPTVRRETKKALMDTMFNGKASPVTLRFLHTLILRNRQAWLPDIARDFCDLYRQKQHIRSAVLTTATDVPAERKEQIRQLLRERYQAEIELATEIDPDIIGGFILNLDGDLYDASIEKALDHLQKELMQ